MCVTLPHPYMSLHRLCDCVAVAIGREFIRALLTIFSVCCYAIFIYSLRFNERKNRHLCCHEDVFQKDFSLIIMTFYYEQKIQ